MTLKLEDIIDLTANQKLIDSFCRSAGSAVAVLRPDGEIVLKSRWQKICADYHRKDEHSCRRCVESDTKLANDINSGQSFSLYQCANGLIDVAAPVLVKGEHVANVFVGQFLLEPPDLDYFSRQADEFGFDRDKYMEALQEVPVIKEKKMRAMVDFLVGYVSMLTGMIVDHQEQLEVERQLQHAKLEIARKEADEKKQKEAMDAFATEYRRVLTLFDGIDDVIYVADPENYELLLVNKACRDTWGDNLIGRKCYAVLQDRDQPCPFCTNEKIFGEYYGKSYVWEFQNEVNNNWYRCSDKAVQWLDGRMVRFEIAVDITPMKLLEQQLEDKNEELIRSNNELEQFAYVASHDLQEPLRMVASYTELLEERYGEKLDKKAQKYMNYAVDGAKRMQLLINDLLLLSRVNTRGKLFCAVDCNELVERVIGSMAKKIAEQKAQVSYDPLPMIWGDEVQVQQLFQNLLTNAIKFHGADNPEVHISAKSAPPYWFFSVADNGIGIDPQYFERIFVIFQRINARNVYQGSGIGLSIVKKIVERHGGSIWVESEYGRGSTFHFSLPEIEGLTEESS